MILPFRGSQPQGEGSTTVTVCQFLPERQTAFHLPSHLKLTIAVSLLLKWQWLKHKTSVLCPYFHPCSWSHALANTKSENRSKATCFKGHTLLYLRRCIAIRLQYKLPWYHASNPYRNKVFFYLQSIHIGSGANPASCSRVSGIKRPRREVDPHLRLVQSENLYFLNGFRGHSCHYPTTVVWYAMPWNFIHRYERFAAKCRIILLGVLPKP